MEPTPDSDFFERVRFRGKPVANEDSMVVSDRARFTVLTPRLLRLEWSETGGFEDRGTYAFPTRYALASRFSTSVSGGILTIDTGALCLRYEQGSRFSADTLSITFELNGEKHTWLPGMSNPSNLRGTRRTLDLCEGDAALEEGLISRAGWSLFDDSRSVLFGRDDGWVTPRPEHEVQDWYFFGYGHDYKDALAEYVQFGGPIPLIPRYVLGSWWSRYWAYSDEDLKRLVRGFEEYDLPLDVLVIDMDWHTPYSWTGYTWNRDLFPDPPAFLQWVRDKGLRVTLNLHPAEGVQSFEEVYGRFAEAMGVDPSSGQAVAFHISDKQFAKNYFELLHYPLEDDGVDFWWIDWQQGESSQLKGLDPLLWLNHLHFHDSGRCGLRPLLYSRWGGLGNHRYQTGFSGDTYVGWSALQFQPYFTATASNVGYGWWGHDIGGHMGGATEPELYARWVQYGALSPSLRLHATKDPRTERRPWKYPEEVYRAAQSAFHWRYQLVPYTYTMARIAHDTGISLCRPMYYEYPEHEEAYAARYQYFFGDQMIAAPIIHPADTEAGLAATDVWVPPGTWIEYTTKETFSGPCWVRLLGGLDRVPMLVKSGAILPLAAPFKAESPSLMASGTTDAIPNDRLILSVFPGERGRFRIYQDDGLTDAYKEGQYEWTEITTSLVGHDRWKVHIAPVEGRCDVLPGDRSYEIRLEGSRRPDRVLLDGEQEANWSYDPKALRTIIEVPMRAKGEPLVVVAIAQDDISALSEAHNLQQMRNDAQRLLGKQLPEAEDRRSLLDAVLNAESPDTVHAAARVGAPFVRFIEFTTPEEASQQLGRAIIAAPVASDDPYDVEAHFSLTVGEHTEHETIKLTGLTSSQMIDTPFAFDGQVQAANWTAKVGITWRGGTMVKTHHSQVLFPTIHTWQGIVYDRDSQPLAFQQVMNEAGQLDGTLARKPYTQTVDGLINVNQPHGVYFVSEYQEQLRAGDSLSAYLATTIISPDEREAVVHYRTGGTAKFYLNGVQVQDAPVEDEPGVHALFRKTRKTAVMRLRAGENQLLVHSTPPEGDDRYWFFGAAIETVDGKPMIDLAFT